MKAAYVTASTPPPPVAAFSGTPLSGGVSLYVVLTDTSTNIPTSWVWDCDTASGANVDFTTQTARCQYFQPGTYTVSLTATNAGGSDSEVKTDYVTVSPPVSTGKWGLGVIASPSYGWTDSPFQNAAGDRIYFMHTPYSILDVAADPVGTSHAYPVGAHLPGAQVSLLYPKYSDLFFVEWNGTTWSAPASIGDINTANNGECCIWLSDDEKTAVIHRDGVDGKSNIIYSRADRNATTWTLGFYFEPSIWPANTQTNYNADVNFGPISLDAYMAHSRAASVSANLGRILKSSAPSYASRLSYSALDLTGYDETQPYISRNELTLLFNRRASGKPTTLQRVTRATTADTWNVASTEVVTTGFKDAFDSRLWGEISMDTTESYAIAVIFDTTVPGWTSRLVHSVGTPTTSFATPTFLTPVVIPGVQPRISGSAVSGGAIK